MIISILEDLQKLIDVYITNEIMVNLQFLRLYDLRFGNGWVDERLNKLLEHEKNSNIQFDVEALFQKYSAKDLQSGYILQKFEEQLDTVFSERITWWREYADTTLNDEQQANRVADLLSEEKTIYTIYFHKLQKQLGSFQNQFNNLYGLIRKMWYLSEHGIACTYFGSDLVQHTVLHPKYSQILNFNHMLVTPEHITRKDQISFMGLKEVIKYIQEIFNSMLANKTNMTIAEMIRTNAQCFPSLSTLIASVKIEKAYKVQLVQEIADSLGELFRYFQQDEIKESPKMIDVE